MSPFADVVVTGLGIVCPIGTSTDAVWESIERQTSGVGLLQRFEPRDLPVTFGGEVRDFDPKRFVRPLKSLKVMCRDIQLGVAAANQAIEDAALVPERRDPERVGVVFGADAMPCDPEDVAAAFRASLVAGRFEMTRWGTQSLSEISPLWMLKYLPNMPACHVAIAHDARGPNNTITLGEVSSLLAVAEAARIIERGRADVMICGGTSSRLQPVNFVRSFVQQMSRRNDAPARACRPFDRDRDGIVNGEGAAALVLESARHAAARGARVLARIVSYGAAQATAENGRSAEPSQAIASSLFKAMTSAAWRPEEVGHVNAHGMSTTAADAAEAAAIRRVLGDVPVTAPKSFFGHCGAGGGAVELVVSLLGLARGRVPPTLNYEHPDPACPVQVVRGEPLAGRPASAVVLNHAATGQAVALAIAAAG